MTILTTANGSLPLSLRKGETLVIRNYSGAETVTGSSSIRELSANGLASYGPQPVDVSVVLSSSGSLDYQIVVGDVTTQNDDFLVAGASRPVIAFFGDSFFEQGNYGWRAPWGRSTSGSVAGISATGLERKIAAGSYALVYTAATRSCSFNGGPATPLVDGFQIIPGPTALTGCGVTVRMDGLPNTDGTITVTRSGSRPDEIVDSKSIPWWLNTFANQGYLARVYGHGGGQIRDGFSIVQRVSDFDGFAINYATNDIAATRTLLQMQADMIQLLDLAYAKSRAKKGVVFGCCTFRTGFSTAQAEIADAYNRWLPGALKAYPGVVARFPWQRLVNDAGTAANTAMMNADNVHPSDPAAQYAGKDLADYFGAVMPGTPWDFGSALGVYSATNPGGNRLLNPNPAGNNSGQPTVWGTLSKGDASATPTKVARTDGVAGEWARITSNSSADNITNTYTVPQAAFVGVPAIGEVMQVFVEVRLSGAFQMVPQLQFTDNKGGTIVWSRVNSSSDLKSLQMTDWVGVIASPPYVMSDTAGTPATDLRIGQRLNNGASGAVLDIGRVWVGTPEEFSIY